MFSILSNNDHSRNPKIVTVVDRWSLSYKNGKWDLIIVVVSSG